MIAVPELGLEYSRVWGWGPCAAAKLNWGDPHASHSAAVPKALGREQGCIWSTALPAPGTGGHNNTKDVVSGEMGLQGAKHLCCLFRAF